MFVFDLSSFKDHGLFFHDLFSIVPEVTCFVNTEHLHSVCVFVTLLCATRGSLLTRSLADIVKKEDFVLDSEYLITLLVVVPK